MQFLRKYRYFPWFPTVHMHTNGICIFTTETQWLIVLQCRYLGNFCMYITLHFLQLLLGTLLQSSHYNAHIWPTVKCNFRITQIMRNSSKPMTTKFEAVIDHQMFQNFSRLSHYPATTWKLYVNYACLDVECITKKTILWHSDSFMAFRVCSLLILR